MPFVGNIIPPALTGAETPAKQADRARERRRAAQPPSAARQDDEAEITSASAVDQALPIRSVKGNADEESHDDRSSQGYYTKGGRSNPAPANRHRLDISG
ncbi:MAG: hypothetical protein JNK58_12615 [Phycisphaerae bacterium]|nr:hypothetical protein [Phycisphaerae bacterium]